MSIDTSSITLTLSCFITVPQISVEGVGERSSYFIFSSEGAPKTSVSVPRGFRTTGNGFRFRLTSKYGDLGADYSDLEVSVSTAYFGSPKSPQPSHYLYD